MKTIAITAMMMISFCGLAEAQKLSLGMQFLQPYEDFDQYETSKGITGNFAYDLTKNTGIQISFSNAKFKPETKGHPVYRMFNVEFAGYWRPIDRVISPVFGAGFGPVWWSRGKTDLVDRRQKMTTIFTGFGGLEVNKGRFTMRTSVFVRSATVEIEDWRMVGVNLTAGVRL